MTGIYKTQVFAGQLTPEAKDTLNKQLADLVSDEFGREVPLVMHVLCYKLVKTDLGGSKAIAEIAVVCASYLDANVGDLCFNPSIAPESCEKGQIITLTNRQFESIGGNLWKRIN